MQKLYFSEYEAFLFYKSWSCVYGKGKKKFFLSSFFKHEVENVNHTMTFLGDKMPFRNSDGKKY